MSTIHKARWIYAGMISLLILLLSTLTRIVDRGSAEDLTEPLALALPLATLWAYIS